MIRVRQLHKRYGGQVVLDDLSLDVARGDVAVVMGPSGGGKSTFLRCLNGLESFDSGSVTVAGLTVPGPPRTRVTELALQAVRARMGMVFQQFHLFPHMTVLENVVEAPVRVLGLERDEAHARAAELLERVGVWDKASQRPARLSGGEQQRVAIARALAMRPEVLLFDEPTSALDPAMTDEVHAVMTDLARGGQTMVVVTHDTSFAERVANLVFVLARGRVLESGAPSEVLRTPREALTRELLRLAR